jgi:hypothetical protein
VRFPLPKSIARNDAWPIGAGDFDRSIRQPERLRDGLRELEEPEERIDRPVQAPRQATYRQVAIVPDATSQTTGAALQLLPQRLDQQRDHTNGA